MNNRILSAVVLLALVTAVTGCEKLGGGSDPSADSTHAVPPTTAGRTAGGSTPPDSTPPDSTPTTQRPVPSKPAPSKPVAPPPQPKSFTFDDQHAGDCTLFRGATWILDPDGTATFDGTVTSGSDHDAWLMWARLKDAGNAELGFIVNDNYAPQDRDHNKFVQDLGSSAQRYRWRARGHFDPALFPLIQHMSLDARC